MYLLYIPWHFPLHNDPNVKGASLEAEEKFEKQYPAVYEHLLSHKEKLSARNKAETGVRYEWYALQRWGADYWEDFSKEKIIYPNMTKFLPFVYDDKGIVTNQKCFILTLKNNTLSLKYLLGFLNSNLASYWILNNCPELQGGTRELSKIFFENLPLPNNFKSKNIEIIELVNQIIEIKSNKESAEMIEEKLNNLIFEVYDFTQNEIKFIKKRVANN